MRVLRGWLVWIVLLAGAATGSGVAAGELRVLFIGNSLTYNNDLPAIVAALAEASKQRRFVYKSVVGPNLSLEDHWNQGDAQRLIASSRWDVVVLQQGPSALEDSRRLLIEYTRRFAQVIRASGAEPALYMAWPSEARSGDFERVAESYRLAALEVGGILLPVGEAWREAWKLESTLALYSKDRFHPSPLGSYLAALVIYARLYQQSPVGLPASLIVRSKALERIDLPKREAGLLQVAADVTGRKR